MCFALLDEFGNTARTVAELTTHTQMLTSEQARKLQNVLRDHGFDPLEKPYTIYAARKGKLNVSIYEKGPKVLVQGKGTEDFIRFVLEPEVIGEAQLGYEEVLHPERFEPHFGVDESGKGDFFGPMVVAGVYVDAEIARTLMNAGVQDSKRITSDVRIREIANEIRTIQGLAWRVIQIAPERYNELVKKMGSVNRLLAWGHARVIEDLLALRPDCRRALSDQFGNPAVLQRAMLEQGRTIQLDQRTKAESDPAVAAASILAREKFIDWMDTASRMKGVKILRGASAHVKQLAAQLVEREGVQVLHTMTKTHFRTAWEIAPTHFPEPPPRREWQR